MAKGDHARIQNEKDYTAGMSQNRLDNSQRVVDRQNLGFEQNYNAGASRNLNDYDSIMNQYRSFLSGGPMGGNPPPPQQQQPSSGYVPPTNNTPPVQSLEGAPHASNPNNAPVEGYGTTRQDTGPRVGPGPGQVGGPGQQPAAQNADQLATQVPGSAEAFIANYQKTHPGEVSKQGVLTALQQAGFNATDFKYGDVSSGNEISLNGQKYKVIGGENSSNPFWYEAGTDDSAPGSGGVGSVANPLAGYSDFARTGGFSPRDIQNIRAQSIAPIRGLVSAGMDEVRRQGKMGNAPNKTAALAKMTREGAYATSDATTNAEANIARMIQSGKLAGNAGLQQGILGANQGMTSLYGSTPGMANTFGNQVLNSTGQELQGAALQNEIARIRNAAQLAESQTPGNYSTALGNVSGTLGVVGQAMTLGTLGGYKPSAGS